MSSGKTYGLSVQKKNIQSTVKHAAFIDSESENSDAGGTTDWVKKSLQKCAQKGAVKKQTKIDMQRAIEQDSTVYQYDEIYDQLELKKNEATVSKDKDRKPKYIQQLMQTADRRKRENERRIERQVQKEREAEGEQFKDKETFVTSAYKKKLEEFAALEEEEKRQNLLEEIGDVTKQQDISGFYRHLYQTTVNTDEKKKDYMKSSKSLTEANKNSKHLETKTKGTPERQKSKPTSEQIKTSKSTPEYKGAKNTAEQSKPSKSIPETNSSSKSMSESIKLDDRKGESKEARQYRKRKQSESSEDSNKDADTSVSSSSSSSESDDARSDHGSDAKRKKKMVKDSSKKIDSRDETDSKNSSKKPTDSKANETKSTKPLLDKPSSGDILVKPTKKPVPDLSIWEKRTVGAVFEEALKRFMERRAARQSKSV